MKNTVSNDSLKNFISHPSHHTDNGSGVGDNLLKNLGVESPEAIMSLLPSLLDGTIDEQGKKKLQETFDLMQSHPKWSTIVSGTFPLNPIKTDHTKDPLKYLEKSALVQQYKELGILDNHGQVIFSKIIDLLSDKLRTGITDATWKKITQFANSNNNTLRGEDLEKLQSLDYSERVNENGITISNLGGIEFSSMETDETPYGTFNYRDLNNVPDDYNKGRSLQNLNSNDTYTTLLTKSGTKSFESLEASNDFHFALMQKMADHLFKVGILTEKVTIDLNFVDNASNDSITKLILKGLRTITGKRVVIPYKVDNKTGLVSSLDCNGSYCWVYRDYDVDFSYLAFFSEIGSSPSA